MQIGDNVNIAGSVEDEDNSKIFTKGEQEDPTYRWIYLGDFSGATRNPAVQLVLLQIFK
jgi:hypothetical protein